LRNPLGIEIEGSAGDSVTAVPQGISVHRIDLAAIVNEQKGGGLHPCAPGVAAGAMSYPAAPLHRPVPVATILRTESTGKRYAPT